MTNLVFRELVFFREFFHRRGIELCVFSLCLAIIAHGIVGKIRSDRFGLLVILQIGLDVVGHVPLVCDVFSAARLRPDLAGRSGSLEDVQFHQVLAEVSLALLAGEELCDASRATRGPRDAPALGVVRKNLWFRENKRTLAASVSCFSHGHSAPCSSAYPTRMSAIVTGARTTATRVGSGAAWTMCSTAIEMSSGQALRDTKHFLMPFVRNEYLDF